MYGASGLEVMILMEMGFGSSFAKLFSLIPNKKAETGFDLFRQESDGDF